MVFLYPEQIINNNKDNTKITLPPSLEKLHPQHQTDLKNMLLKERTPLIITENDKTKAILKEVQKSSICLNIVRLSMNLPVFDSEEFELISCLYEYFTLEIFNIYVNIFNIFKDESEEDENYEDTLVDIQTLLNIYINMCNNFSKNPKQKGIIFSYEEIAEKFYNDALKEKNKLRKTFEKLTPEAREAYNALRVTKGKQKRQNYDAELWEKDKFEFFNEFQEENEKAAAVPTDNEESDTGGDISGDDINDEGENDGNNDNDDY